MNYVMSDLHGEYELYMKMLGQIHFSDGDTLYILGDVLDRGKRPMDILLDMMERPNVVFLCGNHELMGLDCLRFLNQDITAENLTEAEQQISMLSGKLMDWQANGSQTTIDDFCSLGRRDRSRVLDYISDAELYQEVDMGEKTYILVHGGLGNFHPDKELWEYTLDELLWTRPDYETPYFTDNRYVISGHTPTQTIGNFDRPGFIYKKNHHIAIDCGCCLSFGRLACIRLEDEREFYVEH